MQTLFDIAGGHWVQVKDGDYNSYKIFSRHYSFKGYVNKGNKAKYGTRFVGPGERIVMISKDHKAIFVWRREKFRMDRQEGVTCAVCRNESPVLSSVLINEAVEAACNKWPGQRLFTFVNPAEIKSSNPGYCFKKAGWNSCGKTDKGLLILEYVHN